MNLFSLWRKSNDYKSLLWLESTALAGVRFCIRKMSLGQRIDLSSRVRALTQRNEFLRAGDPGDQVEAALADLLVQKLYVEWALTDIHGLQIDGKPCSIGLLIERGPEALIDEIAAAIRAQLEFSDAERKN